ncbi:MAG: RNA polymerase factor sigma-54, partial [Magnetococcales bacterium]|nr:RNA polymerase factor sigma-54 [Magnetococcales bacterium]
SEYLQEELEKNPLLEISEDYYREASTSLSSNNREEESYSENFESSNPIPDASREESGDRGDRDDDYERELPVDANWSDIYGDGVNGGSHESNNSHSGEGLSLENVLTRGSTLADHLNWQLGLSALNQRERVLGLAIIDAIDENGYLTADLNNLATICKATLDEMEDALVLIQSFEPVGVGARNLAECLRLQMRSMGYTKPPYTLILDYLEDLAKRDFRKLKRVLKLDDDGLADVMDVIHSLNPKPGLAYGSESASYVVPDVFVRKVGDQWLVEVNQDTAPKLRINPYYQSVLSQQMSPQDRRYLSDNSRSAQWLIKSLEQRTRTILKVAESIVHMQKDFFEYGQEHLKPLILKDVAEDVGVHESTISRVTNNKYMHTPRGIFELKYFFTSSLASTSGDNHSSEAVKFKLRKLVDSEPAKRPHSDEKLAILLKEQGIDVARRTVAKYREALGIPPSSRRKKLSS